ncbi:MAG TPA: DMT family transporter [Hyphomicrobiaceae bacterium]|jgi:drug/metabolite transporter (DMT)-like permease|nr:DMT family transporter [Hyphomicrobiaceae bacterium]
MPTRTSPSTAFVVGLAIIAEGLLTLMDAMIKSLAPHYSAIEIAFLRYAFGMIGAVVYAFATRPGWPSGEAAIYNGVRAVLIVFTATTFFFALGKLSLADAIAMSFISPALTAVLGVLLLSERLDWRIMIGLVGGFLGMLLIVGGKLGGAGLDRGVLLGAIAVLLSAIGYSLNVIMLRHRATRDPLAQIILFQNVGPALILALPALWVWSTPPVADLVQFAVLGTIGVIAHTMLAHAFARVEAARLAPVGYVTLVWGVLFGFLFFAEVPSLATLMGAALIVVGTLLAQRR